jgi:glycosyltransferase involved in cell wall biosynthesis
MTQQPDLSVVFPVYNEEENIPILLDEIRAALDGRGWVYEIVAVDDGSKDRSLEVLRAEVGKHPMLRVLKLEKNSGQTAALDAAWRGARGWSRRSTPTCRTTRPTSRRWSRNSLRADRTW